MFLTFIIYASLGVGFEVVATALWDFYDRIRVGKKDYRMLGYANLWVFVAYGFFGLGFGWLFQLLTTLGLSNIFIRSLAYGIIMFHIEFFYGKLIEKLSGKCPWGYEGICRIVQYRDIFAFALYMLGKIISTITKKNPFADLKKAAGPEKGYSAICNLPAYILFGILFESVFLVIPIG